MPSVSVWDEIVRQMRKASIFLFNDRNKKSFSQNAGKRSLPTAVTAMHSTSTSHPGRQTAAQTMIREIWGK